MNPFTPKIFVSKVILRETFNGAIVYERLECGHTIHYNPPKAPSAAKIKNGGWIVYRRCKECDPHPAQ